jgi:chitinase
MSDMATHLCVMTRSVFILWLALALSVVSIGRGDVRGFVTEDFFNKIVSGDVLLSGGVGDIATQDLFNGILSSTSRGCAGKSFYTYSNFITATNSFSGFASNRTSSNNKREIAAFFAHVVHETVGLCYVEEVDKSLDYCDSSSTQYPCANGKQYYGRGPLLLSWNYNYGAAGDFLGVDLLNNPGLVAQDDLIAWKTALWIWNMNSNCHSAMTSGPGFMGTIQALTGIDCSGGSASGINDRINHYLAYCSRLGVSPGNNVAC